MDDKTSGLVAESESDTDTSTRYVTRVEWNRKVREEKLRIVISQTNYDNSTAERALQDAGWDCKRAITNYLRGDSDATTCAPRTVNQQIYGEIRKLMDTASMDYNRKKEYEKEYNEYSRSLANQTDQNDIDPNSDAGTGV